MLGPYGEESKEYKFSFKYVEVKMSIKHLGRDRK